MAAEHRLQRALHVFLLRALPPHAVVYGTDHARSMDPIAGAIRKARGIVRGIPDHHVLIDGRAIYFELKTADGRTSPEQIEMGRRIQAAGGVWLCVRSVGEAAEALLGLGIALRETVLSAEVIDMRLSARIAAPGKLGRARQAKPSAAAVRRAEVLRALGRPE